MPALLCPACGEGHSEFDSRCVACGTDLPAASGEARLHDDPLLGRRISHFQVVRLLGRGGVGVVYQAVDLELGREVALKFLASPRTGTDRDEIRFRREAQATASLDHPNIGTVYEIGEQEGRRFIAMAFYDGETLAARLRREPGNRLPVAEAVAVAGQLASALAAAHGAGVVHRDLKPDNVMVLRDGRVKLLDFGLAQWTRWADLPHVTEHGMAVGTAAYMAPEQLRAEESGPATDLWALGVIVHEMLAGGRPFGGERKGMVHNILHESPRPLHEVRPDIPPTLERIAARCLAKEPGKRPADGREILAELVAAGLWESGSSGSVMPITTVIAAARPRPRWRRWAWAAAGIVLILGAAAYLLTRKPEPPVYVAVLKPGITGPMEAGERAMTAANLQAAILRALAALDGIAALDSSQVNAVSGSTVEVARAVAAGEVVTAEAVCATELCQIRLRRLSGADGRVLWTEALQLPPSRPRLFAEAVAAAIRQGYPERRPRFRRSGLEIEEADYRRYLELRQRLARPGDLVAVLNELEELRHRAPEFIEASFLEASVARRLFSESGDRKYLEQGVRVARRARELAPDDPRPLINLFDLDLQAGHLDEAQTLLEQLEAIDPAANLLRRGQLAERRGETAQAVELMTAAVRIQPSWQALLILANTEYRLGRLDPARRHLAELLKRSPGNAEGLRTLAQIELLNDPQRAVGLLRSLVRQHPEAGSLTNLGVAFLLLRRYGEAETSFRRALALQPEDPSAALNLADCLTLLGREPEARGLYRGILAAVERAPTLGNWPMLSIKAQALAHLGKTENAIEAIQQALRLTPDNAQLAFEAAVVYILIDDRGSALFHARRAMARGVAPRWFSFPWFDPLRGDPAFSALLTSR
jgi:tetratricopeptide (TPR) repeat protein